MQLDPSNLNWSSGRISVRANPAHELCDPPNLAENFLDPPGEFIGISTKLLPMRPRQHQGHRIAPLSAGARTVSRSSVPGTVLPTIPITSRDFIIGQTQTNQDGAERPAFDARLPAAQIQARHKGIGSRQGRSKAPRLTRTRSSRPRAAAEPNLSIGAKRSFSRWETPPTPSSTFCGQGQNRRDL